MELKDMDPNHQKTASRAGQWIRQPSGHRAFVPSSLPLDPSLRMDERIIHLLSLADRAIGRLDASTCNLPDPSLFVRMYVLREAELSSQIEGTQATLNDVLEAEAEAARLPERSDVDEILNYTDAMNYGLQRLRNDDFPLSLRLIREIHARLLKGVRGENRQPGEFRSTQNWIGPKGCTLETATFVPPPVDEMRRALDNLERFMHDQDRIPVLVKAALIHAQFETIHPFLDGNGRIGRLLTTLYLCQRDVLGQPLLYLSHYFKNNRLLYYDSLQAVRDSGNWEGWVEFFLQGVQTIAQEASDTAKRIVALREQHRDLIQTRLGSSGRALQLLEGLYQLPVVSAKKVAKMLDVTAATANSLVAKFVDLGILQQRGTKKRYRVFVYGEYYRLFTDRSERQ